ncbi:MAG: UvrD-helicase domain-containing protein [Planctomycetia bacterium]|nr:UvrD-helicase domain-containing protein [Planctomycetia bacterium]
MSILEISQLTHPQREAASHISGPLLVLAGPGSGKTRVVTHRTAFLLERGIRAEEILVLTFTNKAAEEMVRRVEILTGGARVWIGTFHRFCARLLRRYAPLVGLEKNFTIYDTADTRAAMRRAMVTVREEDEKEGRFSEMKCSVESIAHAVSALKSRFLNPEEEYQPESGDLRGVFVQNVLPHYRVEMRLANAVDFDDLLLLSVELLRKHPDLRRMLDAQFKYIMIDEYQDTNLAQYALSRALSMDFPNLMATGDPDQSIYGWRGANIANILNFERDFPSAKVVRLEENFRSSQSILSVAQRLISHNLQRKPMALFTQNPQGVPVRLAQYPDATAEAERIAGEIHDAIRFKVRNAEDFAIFYRMNAQSVEFEKAFRMRNIPFRILHGVEFFERTEVRDILAYLRLLNNPHDNEAFLRVVNVPSRGIGKRSLEHLANFAWSRQLSLWDAAVCASECSALKKRALSAIAQFVQLVEQLWRETQTLPSAAALVREVIRITKYAEPFGTEPDEEESQILRNLEELISLAARFDETSDLHSLEAFLEQSSLTGDQDVAQEKGVSLMTLHASKGLEFPVVYIIACEHGVLPHERAEQDDAQREEERRLFFVGITRAKDELVLTLAQSRDAQQGRAARAPSPFLMELPRDEMTLENFQPTLDLEPLDDSFGDAPEEVFEVGFEETPDTPSRTESRAKTPAPVVPPVPPEVLASPRMPDPPEVPAALPPRIPQIPGVMTAAELLRRRENKHSRGENARDED